jgi:hypothetical protein
MTALRPMFALVLYRLLCLFCAMLVLALPQMASSSAVCMADLELGSAQVPISEEEVHKTCVPGLDQTVLVEHAALCVPAGASYQQDDYVGRCGEVAVPPPKQ